MTTQPLFFMPDLVLEKTAGEVDLPDDPNQWAQQILQELYKQVPYITDYQPHVQMSRVDAERGYGLGHVEIQNQSEAPMDTPQDMLELAGIRMVRIPFVIREKKLSPFDLLINDTGASMPLTENRLRQALFRPQAFDVTSRTPGDQSMVAQLYPPVRQGYGFAGSGIAVNSTGGMGTKFGSALEQYLALDSGAKPAKQRALTKIARTKKEASLLAAILPTIETEDQEVFAGELAKSAQYLSSIARSTHPHFLKAASSVIEQDTATLKHASWESWLRPDVTQVKKGSQGYTVKTANAQYWKPKVELVDRGDVIRRYGTKVAMQVDTTGCSTLIYGLTKTAKEDKQLGPTPAIKPGVYKVPDTSGNEHVGYIVPSLIDVGGAEVPLAIFTNGSVFAVQSDMQGIPAGDSMDLPAGPIGTNGAFYCMDSAGVRMTVPLTLRDSVSQAGQPRVYNGSSYDGQPVEVSIQPNIVDIVAQDGRLLIPATWRWLPLDGAQQISLLGQEQATPVDVENKLAQVEVITDGMSFTLRGVPLLKVASEDRSFLDLDDTLFLLAGLGVDVGAASTKIAEALAFHSPATITVSRLIETSEERMARAMEKAAALVDALMPLRQPLLVKEAASFPDPQMVDTVLSLGFINPENIMTFVSYLPDLEDVQSKMSELLFAVRIGMSNVPQSSLERAIRSTEEVIEGLKVLGFQGS